MAFWSKKEAEFEEMAELIEEKPGISAGELARRLGVPDEKAPFRATDYGNTVSSSIPLLLAHDVTRDDRCLVLSGFGVGISWGSTVLWRA